MNDNIECPFEPGKEYLTRDGRRARVYSLDGGADYPIHGATLELGGWIPCTWKVNGTCWWGKENQSDLMPPKKPHKWYDRNIRGVGAYYNVGVSYTGRVVYINFLSEIARVDLTREDLEHMLARLDEAEGEA